MEPTHSTSGVTEVSSDSHVSPKTLATNSTTTNTTNVAPVVPGGSSGAVTVTTLNPTSTPAVVAGQTGSTTSGSTGTMGTATAVNTGTATSGSTTISGATTSGSGMTSSGSTTTGTTTGTTTATSGSTSGAVAGGTTTTTTTSSGATTGGSAATSSDVVTYEVSVLDGTLVGSDASASDGYNVDSTQGWVSKTNSSGVEAGLAFSGLTTVDGVMIGAGSKGSIADFSIRYAQDAAKTKWATLSSADMELSDDSSDLKSYLFNSPVSAWDIRIVVKAYTTWPSFKFDFIKMAPSAGSPAAMGH